MCDYSPLYTISSVQGFEINALGTRAHAQTPNTRHDGRDLIRHKAGKVAWISRSADSPEWINLDNLATRQLERGKFFFVSRGGRV